MDRGKVELLFEPQDVAGRTRCDSIRRHSGLKDPTTSQGLLLEHGQLSAAMHDPHAVQLLTVPGRPKQHTAEE